MGNPYTRQSAAQIVTGNVVEAAPINAEFNTLQNAFDGSSGHSHDGNVGQGPKISLTNSIIGVLPIVNGGTGGINKLNATTSPTAGDDSADGYAVGSIWIDTTGDFLYVCVDNSLGAAIWKTFQEYDNGLQSISGLTTSADKMIYTTASDTYAVTTLTPFARTMLDDADASTVLSTLGFSTYGKTLIDDINSSQVLTTLGVSNYAKTILDDSDATTALSTLGFSAYGKTLIDDTDASTALSTLGFSAYGKTLIDDSDASTALSTLGFSAFGKTLIDDADATALRTTIGLNNVNNTSDANKPISTATQTALDLKASLIGTETLTNKTLTTPTISLKQSGSPTPTNEGEIEWDNAKDYLAIGSGGETKIIKPNTWELINQISITSSTASIIQSNLSAFEKIRISGTFQFSTSAYTLLNLSSDNGSTWITASDHSFQGLFAYSNFSINSSSNSTQNSFVLFPTGMTSGQPFPFVFDLHRFNKAQRKFSQSRADGVTSGGLFLTSTFLGTSAETGGSVACNALRMIPSAGTIANCEIIIEGIRG